MSLDLAIFIAALYLLLGLFTVYALLPAIPARWFPRLRVWALWPFALAVALALGVYTLRRDRGINL